MPWYPGQNAQGYKVEAGPTLINGPLVTQPRVVTAPGTAGPGTAVTNTTGADCMVYASVSSAWGPVTVNSQTVAATVPTANMPVAIYVPAGQTINITYLNSGTLTWKWLAV